MFVIRPPVVCRESLFTGCSLRFYNTRGNNRRALFPYATLLTKLHECGKSVVCAMQAKKKAPKPNE